MAKKIKTREAARSIKTRPEKPHIGAQMKRAALKTKDAAAQQLEPPQGSSPNEYAGNTMEEKAKGAAHEAVQTADGQGRKAVKRLQEHPRSTAKKASSPEAPAADVPQVTAAGDMHGADTFSGQGGTAQGAANSPTPAESTASDRAKAQNRKAQQKKKVSRQRGGSRADKPAGGGAQSEHGKSNQSKRKTKTAKTKQKAGRTIGRSKNAAKTAQQSARQTQQAAKTAAKAAKTAQQTAQRAKQAAQQAVKRSKDIAKATYKTIKAAIEGAKLLVNAIIAGGWISVVIILVICLAGFLIASPFGIFFSGSGEQSLPQVIQSLSKEYYDRFDLVKHNYVHDVLSFDGTMAINWPQVLAVYAVKVVNDPLDPGEVTTFDEKKIDKLRKILNEMNSFTYSVQNAQFDEGIKRTLTIHIAQKNAAAMAQAYHFNAEEKAQLHELLSGDYADMWAQLLGGYVPGSGEILSGDTAWSGTDIFAWPMQPGYRISSQYGYRDNPTNPGETKFHNGIDLAAGEGTPILAAADGFVTVANATDTWGMGWGLYVKIEHDGGYETMYAHCSKIAVRGDEEVDQGQVIGYVGSTGNSTGNHLHFTVYKNGVVSNPMNYFAAQ